MPKEEEEKINTGAYLRQLLDDLIDHLHRRLEEEGFGDIRPSHGWVFQYLADEGSRITELAEKAKMTKQSMSALVVFLEESSYLERRPDPTDKRAVLFVLTERGKALRSLGRSINKAYEEKWRRRLGSGNYDRFREFLITLADDSGR